ncbi:MFS transporter [Tepidicaulis sp. LMO-SS28]|uniref:MFS transporter n=1 Tax=Tepidicaulis sp. LMO-SS28 TaxID=3447455 RepID=UPI003EE3660C
MAQAGESEPVRVQVPGQASAQLVSATGGEAADGKGQLAWAGFEWARNPYVILITIYIFAPYFSGTVVGDPVRGQAIWGHINGVAGFIIACFGPLLGAIADRGGRRKPWIAAFVLTMAFATFLLWFALPMDAGIGILGAAAAVVIANVAFEFSAVFHNSMLPHVASQKGLARLSGLGLALGNLGSLLILVFMLIFLMLPGAVSWGFVPDTLPFGLDAAAHENSRIAGPIAAIWLLVFAVPLFLFTPDAKSSGLSSKGAVREGAQALVRTVKSLKGYRNVALYLVARMFYNDGKTAVLVFGGVYAAGVFGWGPLDLTLYGVVLSIFAVAGGLVGGWLDDALGSRNAILTSIGMTSLGVLLAVSITPQEIFFVIPYDPETATPLWSLPFFNTLPELIYISVVLLIAIFITAAYANSRTMLARIAPVSKMSEFFGLYALSGTATAFLGPLLVGIATSVFHSQRVGFASVLLLLGFGMALMFFVREERADEAVEERGA